jgi:hypothetical protein
VFQEAVEVHGRPRVSVCLYGSPSLTFGLDLCYCHNEGQCACETTGFKIQFFMYVIWESFEKMKCVCTPVCP